ncbi:MAG: glycoside hydrolase family 3 protein [Thermoleophilaceae bacterium]|nr:glycoside hydrolase family 3 protein [Thermoleophilaceae bacterium]
MDRLSLRQQVGQLTISSFPGSRPPPYIRRRLRAGETAGVILFSFNAGPPAQWQRLTRALQRNAHRGALVMVDQEGGDVRTVGWAGPVAAQPLQGSPATVRRGARTAAQQLRRAGVNVNLAPVADVPAGASAALRSRVFAGDAAGIAERTRAAVEGIWAARLAATVKHFPGLGRAVVNTDDGAATIGGDLRRDLVPFRAALRADVPLVMLSHAVYPALDERRIASQSPRIVTGLLRERLGFDGVVVTDSIEAQAVLDRSGVAVAAERSLRAGADLILMTGSASWNEVHPRLLALARRSASFRERVRRSAARVLELKRRLGLRLP